MRRAPPGTTAFRRRQLRATPVAAKVCGRVPLRRGRRGDPLRPKTGVATRARHPKLRLCGRLAVGRELQPGPFRDRQVLVAEPAAVVDPDLVRQPEVVAKDAELQRPGPHVDVRTLVADAQGRRRGRIDSAGTARGQRATGHLLWADTRLEQDQHPLERPGGPADPELMRLVGHRVSARVQYHEVARVPHGPAR